MTRIIDISPPISSATAVWSGDVPFQREVSLSTQSGDHMTLSAIRSTLHLGAHADAPNHYQIAGESIDQRDLSFYFGPCQVVWVDVARGERIGPEHLPGDLRAPRILFRTGTFPDPKNWNDDFASLSPDLVDTLASHGVRLVGIDTPSIDPMCDRELLSHHAVAAHDMAILEGLILEHVAAGIYTLVALPLALVDADASPVRAALVVDE